MLQAEHFVLLDLLRSRINRNPGAFDFKDSSGRILRDSDVLEFALTAALEKVRYIESEKRL